jgi:hypothetical protein
MKTNLTDAIFIIGFSLLAALFAVGIANSQTLTTVPVMTQGNHDAHDYSFGPVLLPANSSLVRVVFDTRDTLRGDQTLTVVLERSFNGGATYEPAGGETFDASHQPIDFVAGLPQVSNAARVLRGRVTLYGASKWKGASFVEVE